MNFADIKLYGRILQKMKQICYKALTCEQAQNLVVDWLCVNTANKVVAFYLVLQIQKSCIHIPSIRFKRTKLSHLHILLIFNKPYYHFFPFLYIPLLSQSLSSTQAIDPRLQVLHYYKKSMLETVLYFV